MPHSKGSGMELPQPPEPSPMPNRSPTQPEFLQLNPSQYSVLPIGQLRDRPLQIASPRVLTYFGSFGGLAIHTRSVTGRGARVVRGLCRLWNGRRARSSL